ncbi:MAG TPA: type I-C CRISPR-associated protein Cas8c/Csd1 [Rectinemataceae bacterium]|nr:type I-C CRISPR-associated protein Cas8c/Csd1 [Rectinemataceae bacterium]
MILQALYEYSIRKADTLAPEGFEWKEIPFICRIDQSGNFRGFEDTRQQSDSKKIAKSFLVPSLGEQKGSGIKANLLWENAEYVFGVPTKETSNLARVAEEAKAFREKIRSAVASSTSEPWLSLLLFLENLKMDEIAKDNLWPEVCLPTSLVLLSMDGIGILTDQSGIEAGSNPIPSAMDDEVSGLCLVSGKSTILARLLPATKGVRDANPTGASLVAINNEISKGRNQGQTPAFASFMKQQGYNSPIGKKEAESFGKALNYLLRRDSPNKLQVGDATTVFWSERDTKFETGYRTFFAMPAKDDPDRSIRELRAAIESVRTGIPPDESRTRFYVLGLSPNSARIAVRFWHQGTIGEFAENIRMHFDDLEIVAPVFDKGNIALSYLLASTALDWKSENVPPHLAGDVMRAVMSGSTYPATLLQQCLRRIRAEQGDVNRARASILKACLNRRLRFITRNTEKEITVALDPENSNQGYRLGRLFAVLEKIQEDANPGINATIRDRFYGAASSTPVSVFPQLLKLKNHHLSKLENVGFRISHERRLAEIIGGLGSSMPAHLSMDDQARFALGYYHQRQALFASSKDNNA